MKLTTKLIAILAISGFVFAAAQQAAAQNPKQKYSRRYQPNKPTLSPYLNYFRLNTGVLPNYQQFVRPQINLQKTLQQQQAQIRSGQNSLKDLNSKVEQRFSKPTVSPTGHGATFRNYSHYFPKLQRR